MINFEAGKSPFTRVFLIEGGARPDHEPEYQSCLRAGPSEHAFGDIENIQCPSNEEYGEFENIEEVRGAVERASASLVGTYAAALASTLLELAKARCQVDVHVHFGKCTNPTEFNTFTKALLWENVHLPNYSVDDLGAMTSDANAAITETSDLDCRNFYEVLPLTLKSISRSGTTAIILNEGQLAITFDFGSATPEWHDGDPNTDLDTGTLLNVQVYGRIAYLTTRDSDTTASGLWYCPDISILANWTAGVVWTLVLSAFDAASNVNNWFTAANPETNLMCHFGAIGVNDEGEWCIPLHSTHTGFGGRVGNPGGGVYIGQAEALAFERFDPGGVAGNQFTVWPHRLHCVDYDGDEWHVAGTKFFSARWRGHSAERPGGVWSSTMRYDAGIPGEPSERNMQCVARTYISADFGVSSSSIYENINYAQRIVASNCWPTAGLFVSETHYLHMRIDNKLYQDGIEIADAPTEFDELGAEGSMADYVVDSDEEIVWVLGDPQIIANVHVVVYSPDNGTSWFPKTGNLIDVLGPNWTGWTSNVIGNSIIRTMRGGESTILADPLIDAIVCDRISCGQCEEYSLGCEVSFVLQGGSSPSVLYTSDRGKTWAQDTITGLSDTVLGITCLEDYVVVINTGTTNLYWKTKEAILSGTTGGWNSTDIDPDVAGGLTDIWTVTNGAFVVGGAGYIYWMSDPTKSAILLDAAVATPNILSSVHAIDDTRAVAVGANDTIVFTTNRYMWVATNGLGVGTNLLSIWMRNETEWWVGDDDGNLFYTLNMGQTWIEKPLPGIAPTAINDIQFPTSSTGFVVGFTSAGAAAWRTYSAGESWVVMPEGVGNLPGDAVTLEAIAMCDPNYVIFVGTNADDQGVLIVGED